MTHGRLSPLFAAMFPALAIACANEPASRAPAATSSAPPMAFIDVPDESFTRGSVTINYRGMGAGQPILLVHGYGDNLKMWVGLADSLSRDHRVLAIDARGFGKSGKPAGVANYGKAMVEDLVALLDETDVQQAHVVGYSMGAVLGAALALAHPERVHTLTLAAGAFPRDVAAMRALTAPWIDDMEHGRRMTRMLKGIVPVLADSDATAFSNQIFAESDSAALVDALKGFADLTLDWTKVAASKTPTVAIVGVDDPLVQYSRDISARWPGAKLVELSATDHMTVFSSPRLLEEVRLLTNANPVQQTRRTP